jgi:Domain of unknown function (DUF3786)
MNIYRKEDATNHGMRIALDRAWNELNKLSASEGYKVTFLTDVYDVSLSDRSVTSRSSTMPAEDGISLLILHYLIGLHKYGYRPTGEWISFNEIWGGISYFPSYRKKTIQPLTEMMIRDPEDLINNITSVGGGRRPRHCALRLSGHSNKDSHVEMGG